jgi:tetratricopeptide (TPR) repeat protein
VAGATFVGGEVCAECHAREASAWRRSFHARAMQPAASHTILGDFSGATVAYNGIPTTFRQEAGRFLVRTDGPDGALTDYPVKWTFGAEPLQQYVVELPRGYHQLPSIAWDSRAAADGGQRWFHLYPGEKVDHRDALHWTGPAQNWNFMCAECHSTHVRKNYSAADDRFSTTFSDVNVSCEACHGPGSGHVAWARRGAAGVRGPDPLKGLVFALKTNTGAWQIPPGEAIAKRTVPIGTRVEAETCARCHSRRGQIWPDYEYGAPLAQTHRLALLDEVLYESDGQQLDEVFEHGSFLQSKMYAAGVTCSNCHDPHSGALVFEGNAVCTQCHLPATFDTPSHHFHKAGTESARCVSCHMPDRTYMIVDTRRDHSFRVPRPDQSVSLDTPNACTQACHAAKTARWAADEVRRWYGPGAATRPSFAEAIHAGRRRLPQASGMLRAVVANAEAPAIVRATALQLLASVDGPAAGTAVLGGGASDPDPLVRRTAAEMLGLLDPPTRVSLGVRLLSDPVRTVRMAAAAELAGVPESATGPDGHRALQAAIAEYRTSQQFNAERAESWASLGMLESRLGNVVQAEAAYRAAIARQPQYVPPYLNLADLLARAGREGEAEAVLRQALVAAPETAMAHHALGLALIRQKRVSDAVTELTRAAELAPDEARFAYVLGVALHDTGNPTGARRVLEDAERRHPGDRGILEALVSYAEEAGDVAAAAGWAQKIVAMAPGDVQAAQRLSALQQRRRPQ